VKISPHAQGTPEWLRDRLGVVTASKVSDVVTPTGQPTKSATRRKYAVQLAAERLTKRSEPEYVSAAMQRGSELEPVARRWAEQRLDVYIDQVGFGRMDGLDLGASPDGLIEGADALVEIKCPGIPVYCDILSTGEIPAAWWLQMQTQMLVWEKPLCFFVLFTDVRPFSGWTKMVYADIDMQIKIRNAVQAFCLEVDQIERELITHGRITSAMLEFDAPMIGAGDEVDISTGIGDAGDL